MILENFLLFTEIPSEKMLQRQIYVQNIQYGVLLRKGGGLRSCAISIMGSEHQSCFHPDYTPAMVSETGETCFSVCVKTYM